jgi:hypothetical protein
MKHRPSRVQHLFARRVVASPARTPFFFRCCDPHRQPMRPAAQVMGFDDFDCKGCTRVVERVAVAFGAKLAGVGRGFQVTP